MLSAGVALLGLLSRRRAMQARRISVSPKHCGIAGIDSAGCARSRRVLARRNRRAAGSIGTTPRNGFTRHWLGGGGLLLLVVAVGVWPAASAPVSVSPDVTIVLGTNAKLVDDHDVATTAPPGNTMLESLGTLPAASDISGYHRLANGDQLLCFDTVVELPGPLTVQPGDVVRHGATYTIEMAAAANGVPPDTYCDALTLDATGRLVISFDVSVALPGGVVPDDEDLVVRTGPSTWSIFFDGSAAAVPAALDVDGADRFANDHLALSFDGSGMVGGVDFDDEDVLEYDAAGPTWSLAFDGSAQDPDWAAADVDALPEPGISLQIGAGCTALLALGRLRNGFRSHAARRKK